MITIMLEQHSASKFPPQILIVFGLTSVVASIYLFSIPNFGNALLFLSIGILNSLFGWWRIWVNRPEQWFINLLGFFLILILSSIMVDSKVSRINQTAMKTTGCGKVEDILIVKGRGVSTFTLLTHDNSQRITFSYFEVSKRIEKLKHENICISYSFDPHWSDYPYIHNIYLMQHHIGNLK